LWAQVGAPCGAERRESNVVLDAPAEMDKMTLYIAKAAWCPAARATEGGAMSMIDQLCTVAPEQDDEELLIGAVSDEVLEGAAGPDVRARSSWQFSRDCFEC
jgi:hypothetical protein